MCGSISNVRLHGRLACAFGTAKTIAPSALRGDQPSTRWPWGLGDVRETSGTSGRTVVRQRCLPFSTLTFGASCSAFVRLSARFCLSVFADFLLIACRGDLSLIADPFVWGLVGPGSLIVRFSDRLVDPKFAKFAPDTVRHDTADTHPVGGQPPASLQAAQNARCVRRLRRWAEIHERSSMPLLTLEPGGLCQARTIASQFTIHKLTALLPVSPISGGPCR